MWLGFILSFIFGLIVFCCACGIYFNLNEEETIYRFDFPGDVKRKEEKNKKIEKQRKIFVAISFIVFVIQLFGFTWLGAVVENKNFCAEVEEYKASKYTIEMSLKNDDLTGFERIELVKQATEENKWLANAKYKVQIWYNFHLDKSVLQLEMIKLGE